MSVEDPSEREVVGSGTIQSTSNPWAGILALCCLFVLVITVARLSSLLRKEWHTFRENQNTRSLAAADGSLVGIDALGQVKKFVPVANGYLLIFVR
jgi:hypothetical protein